MRKLLSIALTLALLLTLAACGNSEDTSGSLSAGSAESGLSGVWVFDEDDETGDFHFEVKLIFHEQNYIRTHQNSISTGTFTTEETDDEEGTLTLNDNNGTVYIYRYRIIENQTISILPVETIVFIETERVVERHTDTVWVVYVKEPGSDAGNTYNQYFITYIINTPPPIVIVLSPPHPVNPAEVDTSDGEESTTEQNPPDTGNPHDVLIGTWAVAYGFPGERTDHFEMIINADGTFATCGEDGSYTTTGTWGADNPLGESAADGVWLNDPYLVFSTVYRFVVSEDGNRIVLTAKIGNWPVSTLTRV